MDIWAQFLPPGESSLNISRNTEAIAHIGYPVSLVPLENAGTYRIFLTAPEHEPSQVRLAYDGTDSLQGVQLQISPGQPLSGLSLSHHRQMLEGRSLPVHSVYLGLRHHWFSAQGRPARRGNSIALLMDGEQAWQSVYNDLRQARNSILVSTWWWESDFELVRPWYDHLYLSPEARWQNTILGLLESSPAHKKVLVGQLWGQDGLLSWMTVDGELQAYAEAPLDNFEVMGQANETEGSYWFQPRSFTFKTRLQSAHPQTAGRSFEAEAPIPSAVPARQVDLTHWPISLEVQHASYHQKFMVIDAQLAYVGGMNLRRADWDSSAHEVFDHRRMLFDTSSGKREAVFLKEELPELGPRKDYALRIFGPAAQDVSEVFQRRWNHQLSEGVDHSANSSAHTVNRQLDPVAGGLQIQITATLPEPFQEHAIAETWLNGVTRAEKYILIESQYFRAPMLNEAIAARMEQVPDLRLIVITKPVSEWTDPGCAWTAISDDYFSSRFPGRYTLFQLRSFDWVVTWGWDETESRFADIDVHSKMLIVDDKFMSVGSSNWNNRGLVYEGELNVSILNPDWVKAARKRILVNLLPRGTLPAAGVGAWLAQMVQAAERNDLVYKNWSDEGWDIDLDGAALPDGYTPKGLLYGLAFDELSECLFEDVGPDMM